MYVFFCSLSYGFKGKIVITLAHSNKLSLLIKYFFNLYLNKINCTFLFTYRNQVSNRYSNDVIYFFILINKNIS